MSDWLDDLTEDPAPIEPGRDRRRRAVIISVAVAVVACGVTTGLLIMPESPTCVADSPRSEEKRRTIVADAPPGLEAVLAVAYDWCHSP